MYTAPSAAVATNDEMLARIARRASCRAPDEEGGERRRACHPKARAAGFMAVA